MSYWNATYTPWKGCSHISPACDHCFAELLAATRLRSKYDDVLDADGHWTGDIVLDREGLEKPLRKRKPLVWFPSMCDPFHPDVPDEWLDKMFAVISLCPQHIFILCTKRAERMAKYLDATTDNREELIGVYMRRLTGDAGLIEFPLSNVYLMTTVEDQQRADERLPHLAKLAAAGWQTGISYEPALSAVNWNKALRRVFETPAGPAVTRPPYRCVIAGGETGPNARPMHPDWARTCQDACEQAGVGFCLKQRGEWLHESDFTANERPHYCLVMPNGEMYYFVGSRRAGALLDGVVHGPDNLPWGDKL